LQVEILKTCNLKLAISIKRCYAILYAEAFFLDDSERMRIP
jgi:hypothetical protein